MTNSFRARCRVQLTRSPSRLVIRSRHCHAPRCDAAPHECGAVGLALVRRCKRGHSSSAPILKPCKFAVKPVCDGRATANLKVPGACTREAGLDRTLGKDSEGTYRKDG